MNDWGREDWLIPWLKSFSVRDWLIAAVVVIAFNVIPALLH